MLAPPPSTQFQSIFLVWIEPLSIGVHRLAMLNHTANNRVASSSSSDLRLEWIPVVSGPWLFQPRSIQPHGRFSPSHFSPMVVSDPWHGWGWKVKWPWGWNDWGWNSHGAETTGILTEWKLPNKNSIFQITTWYFTIGARNPVSLHISCSHHKRNYCNMVSKYLKIVERKPKNIADNRAVMDQLESF